MVSGKRGWKPRLRAFDGLLRQFCGMRKPLGCRAKFCNQRGVFADLVSELLIHAE